MKYFNKLVIILIILILFPLLLSVNALSEAYPISFISIEAEDEDAVITEGFIKVSDENASGGFALKSTMSSLEKPQTPAVEYSFNIDRIGEFYIFIRAKAINGASDSAFISVNDNPFKYVGFTVSQEYVWEKTGPFILNKGSNTLNLSYRENNLLIDKFILATSQTYYPVGMGDVPIDIFDSNYVNEFPDTLYPLPKITYEYYE